MQLSFRWFGDDSDSVKLKQIRQIPGVKQVVATLYQVPVGEKWKLDDVLSLKHEINSVGLNMDVIESVNVHEDIKLGLPTRDKYIENYKITIRNLAKAGVKVICYNFMPIFDWTRTTLNYMLPDGSTSLAFEREVVERNPQNIIDKIENNSNGFVMPGWEPERLVRIKSLFNAYKNITEKDLAVNLKYFLQQVIPVCEEVGIKMAIHPDDPAQNIFRLPRICKSEDDLDRIISMVDSPSNSLTICCGSLASRPQNDVPHILEKYVKKHRVAFVHARNIKFTSKYDFHETSHLSDDGELDMYQLMKILVDNNFDGYVRPDHGRAIWDEKCMPGYGLYDRALAEEYLYGLIEAIKKSK